MVEYYENYGPFIPLTQNGYQELNVNEITSENYMSYFDGLLNIMRDGIEDPKVQAFKIGVTLADGNSFSVPMPKTGYDYKIVDELPSTVIDNKTVYIIPNNLLAASVYPICRRH